MVLGDGAGGGGGGGGGNTRSASMVIGTDILKISVNRNEHHSDLF